MKWFRQAEEIERLKSQLHRQLQLNNALLSKLKEAGISGPFNELDPDFTEMDLVEQGKVIAAIKAYRERTGAGLKEAKEAIEQAAATIKPDKD